MVALTLSAPAGASPTKAHGAWSIVALLAITIWYASPLLSAPANWSHWDWDKEFAMAEAQRRAILVDGEMPLWNPHMVGGTPLLAFHESIALSPTFSLVLLFGAVLGTKLRIVAGYLIGVTATWTLCRRWGSDAWASLVAAVIAMLSGYVASHLWFGQPMWLALGWLPVAMLALHPPRRRPLLLAMTFVLMFFEGGLDVLFMVTVLLGFVTLIEALLGDPRGLAALALASWGFFALGAVKVIGSAIYIVRSPRPVGDDSGIGWLHQMRGLRQVATALTSHAFVDALPWRRGEWEDMAFVGVLALLLGVVGLFVGGRRYLPWSAGVVFCVVMSMGDGGIPGLWTAVHSLPAVKQFQYPLRFLGVGVVPMAALASIALTRLARIPSPSARPIAMALGIAAGAVPLLATRAILALVFWNPPMILGQAGEFFQWRPPRTYFAFPAILLNRGDVSTILATHRRVAVQSAGARGYLGEAYLAKGAGAARVVQRRMNAITVEVDASVSDDLVVNMCYAPGWVWGSHQAIDRDGLIAFPVPPGASRIEAVFRPFEYRLGLFVSLASIMAIVVRWTGGERRSRAAQARPWRVAGR